MPLRNFRLRSNQPPEAVPSKADPTAERGLSNPDAFFPYAPYISATGVHVCLLVFTAFYLPRTTLSFLTTLNLFQAHTLAEDGVALDVLSLLTSNPLRTVMLMCGGALLLQAWWASWLRTWSLEMRARSAGEANTSEASEQKLQRGAADSRRIQALKGAALTTAAASVAFHVLILLFGAPITSHPLQTYSLALLVALLTVWTPAFVFGPPSLGSSTEALVIRLTWIRLFAELRPRTAIERTAVYPAIGAAFGCWSGAIPIGLDWERPWQAWPLTPAYGAILGYIAGSLAAAVGSGIIYLARTDILSRARQLAGKKHVKTKKQ